jgi:triacylglycerol lipase
MPLPLDEDARGTWPNANYMATASDLAYYPEAEATPKYRDLLGLDARLISRGNTQAYILTNESAIVVAFRGTEAPTSIDGLKDWLLTDAMNLLIVPQGRLGTDLIAAGVSARFHQGFVGAIADIWDPVFEAVAAELKASDRPLWITGHSLGGALALLAGWLFLRKFVNVHQVYTFGGPMIGNKDAVAAFDRELKGKIFRYVEPRDPVPQLPTMSIVANEFDHCQALVGLGEFEPGSFWRNVASHAIGGVFTGGGVDAAWQFIMDRVGAHSMTNYLEIMKKRLEQ